MHTKRGTVKDLICTPEAYSLISLCEKPTWIKALIYKRFCTEQQYRYFVLRDRGRRRARSSMNFEYLKGGWIYMNTKNIYSNKQYWKSYDPCSSKLFLSHSKLLPCHITMVLISSFGHTCISMSSKQTLPSSKTSCTAFLLQQDK